MASISCVIITRNEEAIIHRTLEALKWCDDIVVVDSGSSDRTVEICKEHGCRVFFNEWPGYGPQKQYATKLAKHDWVLSIDADEIVSPELEVELRDVLKNAPSPEDVFFIPIPLVFMDKVIESSGKKGNIRFFNKTSSQFSSHKVHEFVQHKGKVHYFKGVLFHHSYRDIDDYLNKFNQYTSIAASELYHEGKRTSLLFAFFRLPLDFFLYYFIRLYCLKGKEGLVWSFFCAFYPTVKYLKLYEKQRKVK